MAKIRNLANALKKSPWIIPITLVFIGLVIAAIVLMIEDYSTSLAGYNALPTRKANDWVIYFVAALPQLCQVALIYIFAEDTDKKWAFAFATLFFSVDTFTDIYYKAYGMGWEVWVIAFFESTIIYSLGSEALFTLAGGMVFKLLPDFIKQFGVFLSDFFNGIVTFSEVMGIKQKKSGNNPTLPPSKPVGRPPKNSGGNERGGFMLYNIGDEEYE